MEKGPEKSQNQPEQPAESSMKPTSYVQDASLRKMEPSQPVEEKKPSFKLALSPEDLSTGPKIGRIQDSLKNTSKLFESCKNMPLTEKNTQIDFKKSQQSQALNKNNKSKRVSNMANTPVQNKKDTPSEGEQSVIFMEFMRKLQETTKKTEAEAEQAATKSNIKASSHDEGSVKQGISKQNAAINMSQPHPDDSATDILDLSLQAKKSQVKNSATNSPVKSKEIQG